MDVDGMAARLGVSIAQLAKMAGVSRATLNNWRAAPGASYAHPPDPATLGRMAKALDEYSAACHTEAVQLRKLARKKPPKP